MNRSTLCTILSISTLLLVACIDKTADSTSKATSNKYKTTSSITTDAWLGIWKGPEGTFIDISGGNGSYTIIIQDLDGPKRYQGTHKDNQIVFDRSGTTEIIQTSSGADTGMKWLANKSNCLKVRLGEGWCRD